MRSLGILFRFGFLLCWFIAVVNRDASTADGRLKTLFEVSRYLFRRTVRPGFCNSIATVGATSSLVCCSRDWKPPMVLTLLVSAFL